jgi:Bacterial Ig domain
MRLRSTCLALTTLSIATAACHAESHGDGTASPPHPTTEAPVAIERGPHASPQHPHHRVRDGRLARSLLLDHDAPDADTPFGNFWWIGASSTETSAVPNNGVRMEATVVERPAGAAGGCFSVWTSDILDNQMWGQIGYSGCDVGDAFYNFTSFFQVWNLAAGADGTLLVDQESDDITVGLHTFAMYVQSGTTWAYAVDGNVMGACDMGSATGNAPYGVATLIEEGDGVVSAFTPPSIAFPAAMEVMSGTTWGPATTAEVYNSAGLSGVVGHLQDTALADDQMIIGGASETLDAGIPLWNGTTTSGGLSTDSDAGTLAEPYVAIDCPLVNATIGGQVSIPITATATGGIASVVVSVDGVNDEDGGTALQPCTLTTPPYVCVWDTTASPDGSYYLNVFATNQQGTSTYEDIVVNVAHGTTFSCATSTAGSDGGLADAGTDAGHDAGQTMGADAGPTTSDDGGNPEGAALDATTGIATSHSSSGCSCRAAGAEAANDGERGAAAALGLMGVIVVSARRRRNASRVD